MGDCVNSVDLFRSILVVSIFYRSLQIKEIKMKKFILALALVSTPVTAQDRVAQYDFDKDGKVSFEDINRYCSVSASFFARADKNSDGFLSNSEMRTAKGYLFSRCEAEKQDA
jgi:Ca2+-binding EF-hand superfamily protein